MKNKRYLLSVILLVVFMIMFTLGSSDGEMTIVFKKAAQICMECIGIG